MKQTINVGILGFGTVGSGAALILLNNSRLLEERSGVKIRLKRICDRNIKDLKDLDAPGCALTADAADLINDPELDIFVELIGGIEPARTLILSAIDRGKHVVTANKALLATHGREIFEAANRHKVSVGFEASVGGGIPVIKTLKEGLVANRFQAVMGIMNGTANYILSRMTDEGLAFEEVLKEAQTIGYAEADPAYDIEGVDTAHKLAILATLAFGTSVGVDDIYIEGITGISPLDIEFAKAFGYNIKLLAIARDSSEGLELKVHPTMVPRDHLLAQVSGAYNAFYLIGDAIGKIMLYGLGAGKMPTGSAVISDIVDIAKSIASGAKNNGLTESRLRTLQPLKRRPIAATQGRYYFRFSAVDKPGVLAKIAGVLGEFGISIESVVQKGRRRDSSVPIVMLTHEAIDAKVLEALKIIDNLDIVLGKTVLIRIEDLIAI
ncbi:MAG: homoserine dehydrogenase [Dissulfurimicrobium sp.]|uniref:homoserine dehydrogenase n=1 Tax=Dissulfurimicrobium TaxID=1769732 RepID=UPI001EDC3865|nr:homoserine dehydrogenase [Dissulfurimicrobium hydrothermale]UKL14512.1 homoserine dehydrogenase [Dissulfurimicrobium hydrothermale]